MRAFGYEFQLCVINKVLGRVSKLSAPNKGIHPRVQKNAAALLTKWGLLYGTDPSLSEFAKAAATFQPKTGDSVWPAPAPASLRCISQPPRAGTAVQWTHSCPSASKPAAAATAAVASAPRRLSCMDSTIDLSALSGLEIAALAKASQRQIAAKMRVTADPDMLRTLRGLHDQLTTDLAIFYANKAAVEAEDAAAAAAAAAAALRDRSG
jgi:hypothetical protein